MKKIQNSVFWLLGLSTLIVGMGLFSASCGGGTESPATQTYTVTFDINGGSGKAPAPVIVNEGDSINLPAGSGFSRSDYTFSGWNTNSSGTGTNYNVGSSYAVNNNITLYARWVEIIQYTVTFNLNAGNGTTPSPLTVIAGEEIRLPSGYGLSRSGYAFDGWNTDPSGMGVSYTANSWYTVSNDITLYAKWRFITENDYDFGTGAIISNTFNVASTFEWNNAVYSIKNGGSNKNYIVNVTADFTVTPGFNYSYERSSATFGDVTGIKVSLRGDNCTLSISGDGNILCIERNQNIILRGLTLLGHDSNRGRVVYVNTSGTFTMQSGKISDNSAGGVFVGPYGYFSMNGGEIYGNTTYTGDYTGDGGGVYIKGGGFTMNDGEISNNTATRNGGGVFIVRTDLYNTFTMNGGKITNNTANNGGGVSVDQASDFKMYGGTINDNSATNNGGGIHSNNTGSTRIPIDIYDGKIFGNTAENGGGVWGLFNMSGGEITSNNATNGGGVYGGTISLGGVSGGTISGGEISGNTATNGGGVYNGNIRGGEISGNTATNGGGTYGGSISGGEISGNTATNGGGMYNGDINGGKISGNNAINGGGIFGKGTMRGGEISGNTATNGGGMYVRDGDSFHIAEGIIYGSSAAVGVRNTANTSGAALYKETSGTAEYGTYNGNTWNRNSTLDTTNSTIHVVNGVLQ